MINSVSDKLFNELVDELVYRMSKGTAPTPQDPKYFLTMTAVGNQKLLSGQALTITECAVGDANDRYVTPESTVTALVNEFARVPIVSSTNSGQDIAVKALINAQHGGHTIREFGLYDDQGDLVVYGNHPPTYIAHVGDPNLSDVTITATIKPVDASKITVNIADTPAQLYQKMVQTQTSISQIAQTVATDRQHSQDSATAAHRDAQAASQSESSVSASKQRVEQLVTQVEATAKTVDGQSKSVAAKQTAVSSDRTDVMQAKAAVLSAKTNIMNAIASTFKDGGTWTPTAQKEYPDKPNPAHSTSWFIVLPKGQTYTFTSGDLQNDDHNTVEHGSMLYYSAVEDRFHGGGDGSLAIGEIVLPNGTKRGHSITITLADLGGWSGQGGFDGDVVLGEHVLYANDGAIAIKDDDVTHQGLQIGDASAAGQQTFIHSVGNIKAVFRGDSKEYDVYTSKNPPFIKDLAIAMGPNTLSLKTKQDDSIGIGNSITLRDDLVASILIGEMAGSGTTGRNVIGIGNLAANGSASNTIQLGGAIGPMGENEIVIGDSNMAVSIGDGSVQAASDRRDKADINYDGALGLDFILKQKPCSYRYDQRMLYWERTRDGDVIKHPSDGTKAGKRHHQGLIAQDVKMVMDELGVDFAGYRDLSINATENNRDLSDRKMLVYEEFIAPLIKAVQEQQNQIEELKKQLFGQ
ncbi:phage tail protein [Vibrio mediterranei]|uniref:phage tail-collar fiber domain-containing protein n=1 Tax=Vibrio mediterranei TaxID=689 RepID=UPI0022834369|nr:phage tail protein [Vibrio mediterranei]MCY9855796.1 phage tail protein [Vibrio mediterranei]